MNTNFLKYILTRTPIDDLDRAESILKKLIPRLDGLSDADRDHVLPGLEIVESDPSYVVVERYEYNEPEIEEVDTG